MSLNNSNQKVAETREQLKLEKKEKKKKASGEGTSGGKRKRIRIRLIPLWLRILIVALLLAASVILGAMFGYSIIGDGEAKDVFEKSTWTYILDLIEHE